MGHFARGMWYVLNANGDDAVTMKEVDDFIAWYEGDMDQLKQVF